VLERVILAGFGGQGMMFIGKMLAQIGMEDGHHVTYFPSYGAEVRGGTANCHVVISSGEISSPVVETADTLVIMNQPSFAKFAPRLKPDGMMLVNSTLVDAGEDDRVIPIAATQTASDIGDVRVANLVVMGAYNEMKGFCTPDHVLDCLKRSLTGRKQAMFEANRAAFESGCQAARSLRLK
jgi:2-oxoglutarate ferredoxin oxidoreductase subunit gamma